MFIYWGNRNGEGLLELGDSAESKFDSIRFM